MKIPVIIIAAFLVAFLTSFLLDVNFINNNPVRYWLIVSFILVEIITGFILVMASVKQFKNDKN